MTKTLKLTEGEVTRIDLNPFNPYLEIRRTEVVAPEDASSVSIHLYTKQGDTEINSPLSLVLSLDEMNNAIHGLIQSHIGKYIEFGVSSTNGDTSVALDYSTTNNFVSMEDPILRFGKHVENPINDKIVFSSPFGQGKTTFLNTFFLGYEDVYEVFKVFPVNYSVASNEDIFKYIKCDILFQLLSKDVEFDYEEITKRWAIDEFILLNPKKVIKELIKASAQIDKRAAIIYEALTNLNKAIDDYREEQLVDDKKAAEDYLSSIYEEEGSLYEDNFYTQLIRSLLEQINVRNDKETILIIEDLDRIDPEHVFRILNVISAHYDTYKYSGNELPHNKFGFDKIITVCDKNNIKSIFQHRFGELADFKGYFNKFYSTAVFDFKNEEAISFHINMIEKIPEQRQIIQMLSNYFVVAKKILHDLIMNGELTLRDLIKFSKINFYRAIYEPAKNNYNVKENIQENLYYHLYLYLNHIDGIYDRIDKIKNKPSSYSDFNYRYCSEIGFVTFVEERNDNRKYQCTYDKTTVEFNKQQFDTPYIRTTDFEVIDGPEFNYNNQFFYQVLLDNFKYFDAVL